MKDYVIDDDDLQDELEYEKDPETGTKVVRGIPVITKGNHSGMPKRDDEIYWDYDERGHIWGSALGGDNSSFNVDPQARDVNHGGWYEMEQGERDALRDEEVEEIFSEKISYHNSPDTRPEVFMVNDTITYEDGSTQEIHLSFANLSYEDQEEFAKAVEEAEEDDEEEILDPIHDSLSQEEYNELMEEAGFCMDIRKEYEWDSETMSFFSIEYNQENVAEEINAFDLAESAFCEEVTADSFEGGGGDISVSGSSDVVADIEPCIADASADGDDDSNQDTGAEDDSVPT